ncbi:Inner membrane protein YdjM [Arsenophonus endosymbiont of Aleurodicus dispersus]|uniref:metal-dependent hydrolase n=1 Tax=Arsenophonus endosymbiont of Aleurodicus dispersus TaxID=235559 RepID=UPI000EB241FC|nr:metal-dependent hydrolase [Arsenophonus endosymbiont of Aleurodicus dispersus]VAY02299.1 Inner membrane protein YdjM [Arsenophonus endosymbiont of Aleurodicus dispersus]
MTATGHLFFSVSSLILVHKLSITPEFVYGDRLHLLAGTLLGALLPDIDHPLSYLGRLFRFISVPIWRLCGHRGFTHSLLAWVLILLLSTKLTTSYWVSYTLVQAFLLGYFSHLVGDMLTAKGIPFLWPTRINFCFPILGNNSNQKLEHSIAILLAICAILVPSNYQLSTLLPLLQEIKKNLIIYIFDQLNYLILLNSK